MRWIKQYWWAIVAGFIISLLIALTVTAPHYRSFSTQYQLNLWLMLILGLIHVVAKAGLNISLLIFPVVWLFFTGFIILLRVLWKQRRIPTLIPIGILLVANFIFFAFMFLLGGRVWEPIDDCVYPITANNHIRVIYYPLERGVEFGEQQFFLMSYNGGLTWTQVFTTYAIEPSLGCYESLQPQGNGELILQFERQYQNTLMNELITYRTQDAGVTWQRIEEQPND